MKLKINNTNASGKNIIENIKGVFGNERNTQRRFSRANAVYLFALIAAFVAPLLLCLMLQTILAERTMQVQTLMAQAVAKRSPGFFSAGMAAPSAKINFTAFAVAEKPPVEEVVEEKKEAKPIESFRLVGTVSPIAAWVNVDKKTSLVLRNQEFNGYYLETVDPGSVTFVLDDEEFDLFLNFSAKQQAAAPRTPQPPPKTSAQADGENPNVDIAEFNGKDGVITRELLTNLLMNPYAELGKLRIIPNQSGGITVRNLRQDSLLNQLGVKQNDQITGINGVPIKDIPSVVNVMNSMMTGSRLDFDVVRDKQPGKLSYVVK